MPSALLQLYAGGVCVTWGYIVFVFLDAPAGEISMMRLLGFFFLSFIAGWLWPLVIILLLILLLVSPYTR